MLSTRDRQWLEQIAELYGVEDADTAELLNRVDVVPPGLALAQVGEFSFVICAAGLASGAMSMYGYQMMIAVIALSLLISPFWLAISRRLHDMAARKLNAV